MKYKTMKIKTCTIALAAAVAAQFCAAEAPKVREALFPLTDVRLTGGPLKAQQEQNRQYLLRLDPDRLLSRFRSEAGLKPKAPPYGGWESSKVKSVDLAGHILAFWMAGAATTVEATGDEELKRRLLYVIDELAAVQDAHGCGYALATENGRKAMAQIAAGDIRLHGYNPAFTNVGIVNGCFDLVYVLNKVLLGVWRVHEATGSEKAWKVFIRMSDWFGEEVVDKLDDANMEKLLVSEHGSIPLTYVYAYKATGDEKYRRWARRMCHTRAIDPVADGNTAGLAIQHCNAHIPKFYTAEKVARITGEERLHAAAVNAWRTYAVEHAFANGGNGYDEHLFPLKQVERKITRVAGPETCASVNMLILTESLFEVDPSAKLMDFYERVLFDHLLASHDPFKGLAVYHTPAKWGASRTYSREFNSMWCCTGTGFEAPGEYAQMVFSRAADDGAVRVNLFAPATLDWKSRGVRLRQETAFPYGETSCVKIEATGKNPKFAVKIRRPSWADGRFAVYVNGAKAGELSGGYVSIDRAWKAGDRIDVEFPMSLRAETLPGSKNYAAFFYGPTLLVADLGSEGIDHKDYVPPLSAGNLTAGFCWSNRFGKFIAEGALPADALRRPADYLEPTAVGPLTFRLKDTEVLLVPMFALHYSRYAMYWRLMDANEGAEYAAACAKEAECARRAVDFVVPNDRESEEVHRLEARNSNSGENVYGKTYGWRDAHTGGHFAYRLAVGKGDGPLTLVARYRMWSGPRRFNVQVEGRTIFTEDLKDDAKHRFFYREMPIPPELTAGKSEIEVRFATTPGNIAGGLFGLWLVKEANLTAR